MPPVPEPVNWILAITGLLSLLYVTKEKAPLFVAKLRQSGERETRTPRDYVIGSLAALCCACLWAASYASLSYVRRQQATELQLVMYQLGFASLFLYVAALVEGHRDRDQPVAPVNHRQVMMLILFNLGNFGLSVWALSYISASHAIALNNLSPLFVATYLFVRGRLKVSIGTLLALVLVLIGAFLVSHDGANVQQAASTKGMLMAVAAGISFALWTVATEKSTIAISMASRFRLLAVIFFFSYAASATLAYFLDTRPPLSFFALTILGLNGLRVAGVYFLFDVAIRRARPLLASIIVVLQVPLTFPFDYWFNNAALTPSLILGAFLIVFAAAALIIDEIRQQQPTTPAPVAPAGGPVV